VVRPHRVLYLTDHDQGIHDDSLLSIWDELGFTVAYLNTSGKSESEIERLLVDPFTIAVQVGPITPSLLGYVRGISKPIILNSWGSDLLGDGLGEISALLINLVNSNPFTFMVVDTEAGKRIGISSGLKSERITQIPWGVGEEYFKVFEQRASSDIDARKDHCSIFVNRRHESIYQVGDVIRACHLLGDVDYRVRIAGSGLDTRDLISDAAELGILDRVDFLGWLPKTATIEELASACIYVNPSKSDGSSVSMLEAMAAGVVVVASDSKGNSEWVTPESGYTYQSGNIHELSAILLELISHTECSTAERRVLEANKQAFARARWTVNSKRLAQDLKNFLNECLLDS